MNISQAAKQKADFNDLVKNIEWEEICFQDERHLNNAECMPAWIVGSAVDYLARMVITGDKSKAFEIPLIFKKIPFFSNSLMSKDADILFEKINGLSDGSIISACKLVCFDTLYRTRSIDHLVKSLTHVATLQRNEYLPTIENIRSMVLRCEGFFKGCAPVLNTGFRVKYGHLFGDGDFLTETELCDLKTGRAKPTLSDKKQVLLYWYVGRHTEGLDFSKIDTLSIFNPRFNMAWKLKVSQLPEELLDYLNMFCWECV